MLEFLVSEDSLTVYSDSQQILAACNAAVEKKISPPSVIFRSKIASLFFSCVPCTCETQAAERQNIFWDPRLKKKTDFKLSCW